jgi:hypothetical protein
MAFQNRSPYRSNRGDERTSSGAMAHWRIRAAIERLRCAHRGNFQATLMIFSPPVVFLFLSAIDGISARLPTRAEESRHSIKTDR